MFCFVATSLDVLVLIPHINPIRHFRHVLYSGRRYKKRRKEKDQKKLRKEKEQKEGKQG